MGDLKALIEAVGAGDKSIPWSSWVCAVGVDNVFTADDACRGSMDAALALFEELLPDWDYRIESVGGKSKAFVSKPKAMSWNEPSTTAMSARALLLATLKAVEAQR